MLHNFNNAVSCSKSKTKYVVEIVKANAEKGVSLFLMFKTLKGVKKRKRKKING